MNNSQKQNTNQKDEDLFSAMLINIKNLNKLLRKENLLFKAKKPNYGKIKLRKDEQKVIYPNIKNAYHVLKWKPKISFNQGLNQTIKFYKLKNNK